jgi:hypothetical protein
MAKLITVSHISIGEPIKSATSIYTYKRYTLIARDGKGSKRREMPQDGSVR